VSEAHTGTVATIATAVVPQQGSVGIVGVSGSHTLAIARSLFHAPGQQVWASHRILYGYIRHPQTWQFLDTQAESIGDLVGARSPQAALAGLQGKLAQPIRQLRANCLDIFAEIEARIDFAEDLPPLDTNLIISKINQITGNQGSRRTPPHRAKIGYRRSAQCREIKLVKPLEPK